MYILINFLKKPLHLFYLSILLISSLAVAAIWIESFKLGMTAITLAFALIVVGFIYKGSKY